MPRQARLDMPGALHHIMVRGINKSTVFKDEQDKARFLERLGQNVSKGNGTWNKREGRHGRKKQFGTQRP
jgi:hypothetical protein